MSGSNIIHLDAYRPPERLEPNAEAAVFVDPVLTVAAAITIGVAFWSTVFLAPAHVTLSVLDAWSQAFDG